MYKFIYYKKLLTIKPFIGQNSAPNSKNSVHFITGIGISCYCICVCDIS